VINRKDLNISSGSESGYAAHIRNYGSGARRLITHGSNGSETLLRTTGYRFLRVAKTFFSLRTKCNNPKSMFEGQLVAGTGLRQMGNDNNMSTVIIIISSSFEPEVMPMLRGRCDHFKQIPNLRVLS
jgi:hypothetical protein